MHQQTCSVAISLITFKMVLSPTKPVVISPLTKILYYSIYMPIIIRVPQK